MHIAERGLETKTRVGPRLQSWLKGFQKIRFTKFAELGNIFIDVAFALGY